MADLEAVISGAIADAGEASDEGVGETTTEEAVVAEVPAGEVVAEAGSETPAGEEKVEAGEVKEPVVEEDPLAKELGLKPRADGKENRIPYSRVQKIVENKVKAGVTAATTALNTQLAEHTEKITKYETRLGKIDEVEHIMFNDAPRFVEILKTIPGYAEIFGSVKPAATTEDDPEPQPDYDLGGGQFTYSPEGLKAVRAWDARQLEKRITTRFAPIEQAHKAAAIEAELAPHVAKTMEAAYKLEGFKENEAEILKVFQADKSLTVEAAYHRVMLPKLKAERQKMRDEILAELKAAPKATSVIATASKAKVTTEPQSLDDVIMNSLKAAKL